jgi:valyl-tRNA synthetase
MTEIPKQYNPKETEDKWSKVWGEQNLFHAQARPDKKPFCIVIPPPNVTGILHMGHALNNTIQDILIRYHRMKGEEALWMPGTDHAGIATQNVVEKSLAKEDLKRQDLGREKFIERVWKWREQYGSTIIRQLKKMGASCDWQRTRFTMDEEYSRAVMEVFIRLYEKGLIYQGSYIINWCPRCQTALSDEEAPHRDLQGNLYYLKYPLKNNPDKFVVVATTRPETMLGDTAVAVNPKDKRYQKLVGETLILPLLNREIKIIADSMVDMKFGTGAVKVTPAHDPNDYTLGKKHGLDFVNVMHPDGRMNENAGEYRDMDRFEAREVILEDLKEKKLLEKIEPHALSAGHCYRCHTIIEPYLSKQWFVKMKPLAKPAIAAVKKGKIKFYPARWTKVYLNWMENIQDWCISRQIWWGHRLPVYYCKKCQAGSKSQITNPKSQTNPKFKTQNPEAEKGIIVSKIKPEKCPACGSTDIYQDEDVLDTWFSSWLWPFATFGWPGNDEKIKKELAYFYPTSVLVTAPEIIFFWVARMIMAGFEFMNDIPFKDVYIHGTVRDIEGKKMSKSLGNVIDPLDIISEYGTDALRFSLIAITAQGQDVFLSKERFEQGRNLANKIWNATRLILMNLKDMPEGELCQIFQKENLALPDRWILSRLYTTLGKVNYGLENFRFNEVANLLYEFIWHEFCDWYLEIIKDRFSEAHTRLVVYKVLEKSLRMLHPIMPFISEEIWQIINPKAGPITISPWPHLQKQMIDRKIEGQMEFLIALVTAVRNIRSEWGIDPFKNIDLILKIEEAKTRKLLEENSGLIKRLIKIDLLTIAESVARPEKCATGVVGKIDFFVPLSGIIDVEKEKSRLEQQIAQLDKLLSGLKERLKNKDFLKRAPAEIVEKEKVKESELAEKIAKLKKAVKSLA